MQKRNDDVITLQGLQGRLRGPPIIVISFVIYGKEDSEHRVTRPRHYRGLTTSFGRRKRLRALLSYPLP